jgi:hypothetical protein
MPIRTELTPSVTFRIGLAMMAGTLFVKCSANPPTPYASFERSGSLPPAPGGVFSVLFGKGSISVILRG